MFTHTIASPRIAIQAPIAQVWAILVDLAHYSDWNPFVPRLESTLVPGDSIRLYVQMNARRRLVQTERVTRVDPPRCLAWRALYPPSLISGERVQELVPLADAAC